MKCLLLVLFLTCTLTQVQTPTKTMMLDPATNYQMSWYVYDGEIFITLSANTRMYLSIGLARTLDSVKQADIWVCSYSNGVFSVTDRYDVRNFFKLTFLACFPL